MDFGKLIFWNYFETLSFISSNNTPGRVPPVKYHLCWICDSNKNKTLKTTNFCFSAILCNLLCSRFWNHSQAEISPWSPMFLNFLKVFHMLWKNQESYESWLIVFWVSMRSKIQKISTNNFFLFLSNHYGFTNYFKIIVFAFFSIIPKVVSTCCKILLF